MLSMCSATELGPGMGKTLLCCVSLPPFLKNEKLWEATNLSRPVAEGKGLLTLFPEAVFPLHLSIQPGTFPWLGEKSLGGTILRGTQHEGKIRFSLTPIHPTKNLPDSSLL